MATQRQISANRKNAERSTGPSTDAGKAASSRNALRHGLTAKRFLLDGEDPDEYELMRRGFHADFKPSGAMQEHIVDNLADAFWRLRRVPAFEAALLEWHKYQYKGIVGIVTPEMARRDRFEEDLPRLDLRKALCEWVIPNDVLAKLSRYEAHLTRQIEMHLAQLKSLQGGSAKAVAAKAVEAQANGSLNENPKPLRAVDAIDIEASLAPRGDGVKSDGPAG